MRSHLAVIAAIASIATVRVELAHAYDNGALGGRMPSLGWSSWVGLAPPDAPGSPEFDFCSEDTVKAAADAMEQLDLYSAGPGSSTGPQLHLR